MNTLHRILFQNAKTMKALKSGSIDLVVTSPPYPMIEMWDDVFKNWNPRVNKAFKDNDGDAAFELMHQSLDAVWDEVVRVLKNGGFACINIGDATRTVNGCFRLYPNHSRIQSALHQKGLSSLPAVIWRKQTNAPNKFMGSGVLPAGAYVTLEHEYVLIFRKGGKREFDTADDRADRQNSALFWEERNQWFSDIWMDLKGARQGLVDKNVRKRSGAFPFELPYRLINMYSIKKDTVLDPFLGTGTTMFAAMASCRNSVGVEIDKNFLEIIDAQFGSIVDFSNDRINERLQRHEAFVRERIQAKGPLKYSNCHYGFPVIMNQEKNLMFNPLLSAGKTAADCFEIQYSEEAQSGNLQQEDGVIAINRDAAPDTDRDQDTGKKAFQQLELKI
jgi:DNA modification methylase